MKRRNPRYCTLLALAGLAAANLAHAQVTDESNLRSMRAMSSALKSGPGQKLGTQLQMVQRTMTTMQRNGIQMTNEAMARAMPGMRIGDGYIAVTAYAIGEVTTLKTDLESRGMINATVAGSTLSGRVPLAALNDMAASPFLRSMRPVMAIKRVGLTTSQADIAMRSAEARATFGVNGTGIKVGVLSDSYDCSLPLGSALFTTAAQDIANDDLPPNVQVLKDLSPTRVADCSDEGRAMMQLIHDIAPAAPQAFYTAFVSDADFAAGIRALANAGAKVVVDDIGYLNQPFFQDGIIAQAVDDVTARGVSYFSAAGNDGRNSYASAFRNSGGLHDFDPGAGTDTRQSFSAVLPAGGAAVLSFQWDQPFFSASGGAGTRSDIDILFVNANGTPIVTCDQATTQTLCQVPGVDNNIGGDALEIPQLVNLSNRTVNVTNLSIAIQLFSGAAPGRMQYLAWSLSPTQFLTNSPTLFGHPNSAGAEAVAAAAFFDTAAFGSTSCNPACAESFSSPGGIPILFNRQGARLPAAVVRTKPGITAPDGTNTTFFGGDIGNDADAFPNFFGTSAAAPHAAGVAALLYDARARSIAAGTSSTPLTPAQVVQALRGTALDITRERLNNNAIGTIANGTGVDVKTGAGLINAVGAVQRVR
jgi:subtilisin family serine protease